METVNGNSETELVILTCNVLATSPNLAVVKITILLLVWKTPDILLDLHLQSFWMNRKPKLLTQDM